MTSDIKQNQVKAYNEGISLLEKRGFRPTLLRLYNDTSKHLNDFWDDKKTLDIVPPHLHQYNANE